MTATTKSRPWYRLEDSEDNPHQLVFTFSQMGHRDNFDLFIMAPISKTQYSSSNFIIKRKIFKNTSENMLEMTNTMA